MGADCLKDLLAACPLLGTAVSELPAEDQRVIVYKEIEKKLDAVSPVWDKIASKVDAYNKSDDTTLDLANAMPALSDPLRDQLAALPLFFLTLLDTEGDAVKEIAAAIEPKVKMVTTVW